MIYNKIKELCNGQGISVRKIEQKAGLSTGSICKWNVSSPTVDNLQAAANALNVPIGILLENKEGE